MNTSITRIRAAMQKTERLVLLIFAAFIMPVTAFAAEEVPPMKSPKRILWAMKCAGPMPALLVVSLAVICALIIISVIYYRKGGKNDEQ